MRVGLQEQLDDLGDRAAFRFVGHFCIEIQQEAPQAVAPAALGGYVVVHPLVGVARRGEALGALAFVVVVEADPVGALAALGDIWPRRALTPRPSHCYSSPRTIEQGSRV
jgi:hypothetical protein